SGEGPYTAPHPARPLRVLATLSPHCGEREASHPRGGGFLQDRGMILLSPLPVLHGERSTRRSVSEGGSGEGQCTAPHPARTLRVLATLSPHCGEREASHPRGGGFLQDRGMILLSPLPVLHGERSTRRSVSEGGPGEGPCTAPHPARTLRVLATLSPHCGEREASHPRGGGFLQDRGMILLSPLPVLHGERSTRRSVSEGGSGEGQCTAPHPARPLRVLATL